MKRWGDLSGRVERERHTVNHNGNTFCEFIAVGANKGRDSAKRIDLQVVLREVVVRIRLNDLEFQIVGLGDSENGSSACITLYKNS